MEIGLMCSTPIFLCTSLFMCIPIYLGQNKALPFSRETRCPSLRGGLSRTKSLELAAYAPALAAW
jgi:hypothetical protein